MAARMFETLQLSRSLINERRVGVRIRVSYTRCWRYNPNLLRTSRRRDQWEPSESGVLSTSRHVLYTERATNIAMDVLERVRKRCERTRRELWSSIACLPV